MTQSIQPRFVVSQSGTSLNVFHAKKGEGLPKHEHTYPHLTLCHAGSIVVRKDGRELIMTKDTQPVNLVAAEWHEIEALEDETVFVNVISESR